MENIKKSRDPFIDNARFILVLLVVIGHLFLPIRTDHVIIKELNNLLGLFRMPALILLTGYLSKGFNKPGYLKKITIKLLIPYFIFQAIFTIYYFFLYSEPVLHFNLFSPKYTLWFLLSLFTWNVLLYVFTRLKHPIIVATIIGVLVGYVSFLGHFLSLHRTFVFLPFFLAGHYMKLDHLKWVKRHSIKIPAIVAFVLVWFLFERVISPNESLEWIYGRTPYMEMGYQEWYSGLLRLLIYGMSITVAFAFMAFVPERRTFFTDLGKRTAYIYILHGAIVEGLYEFYIYNHLEQVQDYLMLLIYGMVITAILSSPPVVRATKPLVEGQIITRLTNNQKPYTNS